MPIDPLPTPDTLDSVQGQSDQLLIEAGCTPVEIAAYRKYIDIPKDTP